MGFADYYIKKNEGFYFFNPPELPVCNMVIVIPCYDEPEISKTIHSLFNCENPGCHVALFVVVNSSIDSPEKAVSQNEISFKEIVELSEKSPQWLQIYVLNVKGLPSKNAGVGWARKIGMDMAVVNFNLSDNKNGIIISLDADTLVENNYLTSIKNFYNNNPDYIAASIYFEHPLNVGYTNSAIVMYELYMRYYKNAVTASGFAYSVYSVGSCFSVLAKAYVSQGGMNRRKAGEDFYFLNKLHSYGKIGEINTSAVFPSSRVSDRVPFGTGPVINKLLSDGNRVFNTYAFDSFLVLRNIFLSVDIIYENKNIETVIDNIVLKEFCRLYDIPTKTSELISNCSNISIFRKRFFHIFDSFVILKWLNFASENGFNKIDISDECFKLLSFFNVNIEGINKDPYTLLQIFRKLDKGLINKD